MTESGIALRELPVPEPGPGEALVRVQLAGICNTDLEIARGYMGFRGVLGHELYGVVERCDKAGWVGARVAGEINYACRRCPTCRQGLHNHCPTRRVMGIVNQDGCFAEYVCVPVANLHRLPDALTERRACFVEPLAAAFEIPEQVELEPGSRALVLGDGKLGLLAAQVLALSGCKTSVVGRHPKKLALASSWGLSTPAPESLAPKSFDVVVEATGAAEGMQRAVELTRPRGTLVLKSTYHGALNLDAAPIVIDELTLVGSRCGPFEPAIEALADDFVSVDPLVDEVFALKDALAAFERARAPGVLKVLLDMRR